MPSIINSSSSLLKSQFGNQKSSKKTNLTVVRLLFLFCFLSFNGFSQAKKLSTIELLDKEYLKKMKRNKVVGASMALIENGTLVYDMNYGFEDIAQNKKANSNTIYKIQSITKSFTAIAVMQLHEKGLLDINESIKKYIPEFKMETLYDDDNEIIIKDILTHSAGLPSDIMNGMIALEVPDIHWTINELNKVTTSSPRHLQSAYSNIGYALLGELIHRVSGLSFERYVIENICKPTGMHNTKIKISADKHSKAYVDKKEFQNFAIRDQAAGAFSSSSTDMIKFTQMILQDGQYNGKSILTKKSFDEIKKDHILKNVLESTEPYGYGIERHKILLKRKDGTASPATFFAHSGDGLAFHAVYGYIPELNLGGVILTNTDSGLYLRSISTLFRSYLKHDKEIELTFDYDDYRKRAKKINTSFPIEEILGTYNIGMTKIQVDNIEKIKFKIDNINVILKRKENSSSYSIKILLLGFIPFSEKDVEFRFEKINNKIYLRQLSLEEKSGEYLGCKAEVKNIPSSWREKCGELKIVNNIKTSAARFDFEKSTNALIEKDGFLYLKMQMKGNAHIFYLNIISDKLAITGGLGRHSGDNVKILENGNLYFWGFEFSKKENI